MATPSDTPNTSQKKNATNTAGKPSKKTAGARQGSTQAAKKQAAKKSVKQKTKTAAPKAARSDTDPPLRFDFSDSVQGAASSSSKKSQSEGQSAGLNKAKAHAERAIEELTTAAAVGFNHVSQKLDAAVIRAKRESAEALKKGEHWVKEHPVAASVAGSMAASAVASALKKLFKR